MASHTLINRPPAAPAKAPPGCAPAGSPAAAPQLKPGRLRAGLAAFGQWLQAHRAGIQAIQWCVVVMYFTLLIIPAFMPLPPQGARILHNLTLFAQFIFWGIWWPFVILSMVLVGRLAWCGVFCPEGALAEWSSRRGLNAKIPRWIKWRGWPAAAFVMTTLYGQLISVYDYGRAALLILGGSTAGAIAIGLLYGRGTRVWCRYLCPVNGVFNLLSRLAPISFKAHEEAWVSYKGPPPKNPQCPPMINIRRLNGVSACHMCGRCAGYRHAVALEPRSPNEEVRRFGAAKNSIWEMRLLLYGMIGVAIGAFTWTVNPAFVSLYQTVSVWLVNHNIYWPLNASAPWFILTNYPDNNDSFSWAYGACVSFYILAAGAVYGGGLSLALSIISRLAGFGRSLKLHLAQGLIPLAGAGLFLGLTATTIKILGYDGIAIPGLRWLRLAVLAGGALWSLYLGAAILADYRPAFFRRAAAQLFYALCLAPIIAAWYFMFWGW